MARTTGKGKDVETRFGGVRSNPMHRGGGSWRKEETLRYKLQSIVLMPPKEIEQLWNDHHDELSSIEIMIIRACQHNLSKGSEITMDDIQKLIDQIEPKPAQRIEQVEMPAPKPFDILPDSDHPNV